jgi:hypothetical protein
LAEVSGVPAVGREAEDGDAGLRPRGERIEPRRLDAAQQGHVHVQDRDIHGAAAEHVKGLLAVLDRDDLVAGMFQHPRHDPPVDGVVVRDEHAHPRPAELVRGARDRARLRGGEARHRDPCRPAQQRIRAGTVNFGRVALPDRGRRQPVVEDGPNEHFDASLLRGAGRCWIGAGLHEGQQRLRGSTGRLR